MWDFDLRLLKANDITFLLPGVFQDGFPSSLSAKVTNGMADVIPNAARSNAWVGEDCVGTDGNSENKSGK